MCHALRVLGEGLRLIVFFFGIRTKQKHMCECSVGRPACESFTMRGGGLPVVQARHVTIHQRHGRLSKFSSSMSSSPPPTGTHPSRKQAVAWELATAMQLTRVRDARDD